MLDYIELAKSRLTNVFTDKPKINALVEAMVTPFNEVEATAWALRENRWIETGIGKQLDGCGAIVGEKRQGRTDEEYREALFFRVFVNTSNGTPEDLIYATKFLTQPDDLQYIEHPPMTAMIFTDGPKIHRTINQVIQDLAPAGVGNIPVMVSFSRKSPFRFSRESPKSELFVGFGAQYFTIEGHDLQISRTEAIEGSRFGGLALGDLFVGDFYLDIGADSFGINNPQTNKIITSGSNLTGLYSY